ncbi:hypothetical protein GCM10011608_42010 [Micromonospora sonchi]|uniref:Luciferase-like domain-containing protein n=1 Tax=Micromonospora sonchi TaxID=1763543 RepID=A0A917U4H6_9ACTN|nr:LLM class flavin-dependent oxidoreductase [Micromonospora sonchi]GGM52697.1 hypothetical protein GCM10011608_42010 [Micromonospora sonchi]
MLAGAILERASRLRVFPDVANLPLRSPVAIAKTAAGALREAVEVVRLLWSDERSVRFSGRHHELRGAKPGPQPAHDIGVWLGVGGPKLLEFVGRSADGWVPSASFFPPGRPAGHARPHRCRRRVRRS